VAFTKEFEHNGRCRRSAISHPSHLPKKRKKALCSRKKIEVRPSAHVPLASLGPGYFLAATPIVKSTSLEIIRLYEILEGTQNFQIDL
jgi:hypothetical protein